jgi:hypothetical protein
MKYLFLTLIFLSFLLHSADEKPTINPEKPAIDQSKIAVSVPGPGAGLGDASWGKPFDSIREQILSIRNNPDTKEKIEIVNEVKDKTLLVKRNNISYLYRFYKKPKILAQFNKSKEEDHTGTSMLFSIGIYFSPVESLKLKKQIEEKYGKAMKEPQAQIPRDKFSKPQEEDDTTDFNDDSKKIAGAYTWTFSRPAGNSAAENANNLKEQASSKGEFILQWVEPYNKKAFSKRMDYFSISKSDIINIDYKDYFSARETDILLDLINEGVFQETDKDKIKETEVTPAKEVPAKN